MTCPERRWSLEAMQALCVSVILAEHSFRENPQNTQRSNATEINTTSLSSVQVGTCIPIAIAIHCIHYKVKWLFIVH